jgi:hypothetical protein
MTSVRIISEKKFIPSSIKLTIMTDDINGKQGLAEHRSFCPAGVCSLYGLMMVNFLFTLGFHQVKDL